MFAHANKISMRYISRNFTSKGKKSSNLWKMEHMSDPFVKEAERLDLRSRAAFKLKEINMRYNLIKKDHLVVDLGASPGGWSQAALEYVGTDEKSPKIFAIDVLPMDYVNSIQQASWSQVYAGRHHQWGRFVEASNVDENEAS